MGITVVTNKVVQSSDLMLIDQYIKNSNNVNTLQVEEPRLPKSKSYLKIIGIPYYPPTATFKNASPPVTSKRF